MASNSVVWGSVGIKCLLYWEYQYAKIGLDGIDKRCIESRDPGRR